MFLNALPHQRKTPAVEHNVNHSFIAAVSCPVVGQRVRMIKIELYFYVHSSLSAGNPFTQCHFFETQTCEGGSDFICCLFIVVYLFAMTVSLVEIWSTVGRFRSCLLYYATFKCYRKFKSQLLNSVSFLCYYI